MGRQRGAHYRDKKEETINERKKEKGGKLAKNLILVTNIMWKD